MIMLNTLAAKGHKRQTESLIMSWFEMDGQCCQNQRGRERVRKQHTGGQE